VEDIKTLEAPGINKSKPLQRVLETIKGLKEKVRNEVPIIGVVMSPFSLPVMQLGFEKYLDIMYFRTDLFERLMQINESFCVEWANAQLEAGATAICYFDPVSSTTIIPRELYQKTGFEVARRTLSRIQGATATHFASGKCLQIIDLVTQTGTAMIGGSVQEDLGELKKLCKNKMTVLGNLNAIEMHRWTPGQAQRVVQDVIRKAAGGGGFILSDNHGEIPFQISDEVLHAISDAVRTYGQYPILQ
jgi:uroporphyrinogen decarboxylase